MERMGEEDGGGERGLLPPSSLPSYPQSLRLPSPAFLQLPSWQALGHFGGGETVLSEQGGGEQLEGSGSSLQRQWPVGCACLPCLGQRHPSLALCAAVCTRVEQPYLCLPVEHAFPSILITVPHHAW